MHLQSNIRKQYVCGLPVSTSGSTGLDLAAASDTTLLDTKVCLINTNVYGPLPTRFCGLILGRSSVSKAGLFVLPGVTDSNYTEKLKL